MNPRLHLPWSIASASAAIIAFQIVLMQVLALAQWHHFAYMVISTALLGFGAAGTVLVLLRGFLTRHYRIALPALFLGTGITMAATGWLSGLLGDFDAFLLFFDTAQIGLLLFSYLVYSLPFFLGGLAITLAFYREVDRIGLLYFANMAGSGAGAVLVIGLLWVLPPAHLAGLLALLPLLSAWLVRPAESRAGILFASGAAVLLVAFIATAQPGTPRPSEYKPLFGALLLPGAEIVHRASSPYGSLEVVRADAQRFAPALSLRYRDEPPVRDVMFNNGEYYGTLLGRGEADEGHILDWSTRSLPYFVRRPASVLAIDAATGTEVSLALAHGARRIDAVEPNRQAIRLLRDVHPGWIDGIYRDPAVAVYGTSARSFLARRTDAGYDLIVLPVLGAFGGTSGVQALQERYTLTVEGFTAMWERLSDHGMIAVTVWEDHPPRKTLRLPATWRRMLQSQAIADPAAHVVAVRSWGTITYLLSRSPWTPEERERILSFSRERGFDPLLLTGVAPEDRDRFNRLPDRSFLDAVDALWHDDALDLLADYPFDIGATSDDRPFFGHFVRWTSLPSLYRAYGPRELPYLELGFVLALVTFVQIVLAAVVLIVLPLLRIGWAGTRRRWTFLYFAGTGIGFMLFEIVLIQKMVLHLGQPVYAAAAVLATLLIGSGAGSLASSRLTPTPRVLAVIATTIAALVLLYAHALAPLLDPAMGWSLPSRAATVFVLLALPSFVMGMMFPLGLRRLAGRDDTHIPWACGIDSSLSVSATALATLLALQAGFGAVMLTASAAYVLVAIAGWRLGSGTQ